MSQHATPKTASMQGAGFYNRNSTLQAANLTSALPLLQEAAREVRLGPDEPIVIADYGSSQGRNSLPPIAAALAILRERASAETPVEVVHIDLPSNDFQSLFTLLADDPASYLATDRHVYPSAIGRSYFAPVLPPRRVHLGWSSNAVHWLSRNPVDVPDHGWAKFSASEAARNAVEAQLDQDWRDFLEARGSELRPGGRLVCQFMGQGPDTHGFEWMAGHFWQALAGMGREGMLADDELLRMTCPSSGRTTAQIAAPFENGTFAGLRLTHVSAIEAPDPFWPVYEASGDAGQLGRSWAAIMRAANGPNFVAALHDGRDHDAFLDTLTERVAARVSADPQRSRSHIALVVVEKD